MSPTARTESTNSVQSTAATDSASPVQRVEGQGSPTTPPTPSGASNSALSHSPSSQVTLVWPNSLESWQPASAAFAGFAGGATTYGVHLLLKRLLSHASP